MPLEKSAGAIIFRKEDGRIYYLLLHYKAGHWDFPKGHIEIRESEKDTVRREVEEETGLKDIQIIDGFREGIKYFFRVKNRTISKIVVFYLAQTRTKEIKLSFEHIGYKWLSYEEAIEQLNFKNAKKILEKAHYFFKPSFT